MTPANFATTVLLGAAEATAGPAEALPVVAKASLVLLVVVVVVRAALRFRRSAPARTESTRVRASMLEWLVDLGLLIAVALLGFTSLYSVLELEGMHGWWLFGHMAGAGAFLAFSSATALIALQRSLRRSSSQHTSEKSPATSGSPPEPASPSWTLFPILILSVLVMGTILLSMLPLAGTPDLQLLAAIHGYSGFALLVLLAAGFPLWATRTGARTAEKPAAPSKSSSE